MKTCLISTWIIHYPPVMRHILNWNTVILGFPETSVCYIELMKCWSRSWCQSRKCNKSRKNNCELWTQYEQNWSSIYRQIVTICTFSASIETIMSAKRKSLSVLERGQWKFVSHCRCQRWEFYTPQVVSFTLVFPGRHCRHDLVFDSAKRYVFNECRNHVRLQKLPLNQLIRVI